MMPSYHMLQKRTILAILLGFNAIILSGQDQATGIVVHDKTHEPVPFVSIAVLNKPIGTVSNQNGAFNLHLSDFNQNDSLGFYFIGFETYYLGAEDISENMVVKLKEKILQLDEVSVVAKRIAGKELLRLAVANHDQNYPSFLQERQVFKRRNSSTKIKQFSLELDKSSFPEIDDAFIKAIEDSIIRYNRSYTDYLYALYNSPDDSVHSMGKIRGIKRISLNEEIGGEMQQVEDQLKTLFSNTEKGIFWKLKTGILSIRMTEPNEDTDKEQTEVQPTVRKPNYDSTITIGDKRLYTIDHINRWEWDFITKPGRYSYTTRGIIPVRGDRCYVVEFKGRAGKDYAGKLFISEKTYAILRIEYQLKNPKAKRNINLLGVKFKEPDDSGVIIYDHDEQGYYLKYAMSLETQQFSIVRPFQLIQKIDRPLFNKKLNSIKIHLHFDGFDEQCNEVLVINRKALNLESFHDIQSKPVKTQKITSYSEDIWRGFSIIEPTRQMKEYQIRKD